MDEEMVVDKRGRQADEPWRDRGGADIPAGHSAVEDLAHATVPCGEHVGAHGGVAVGVGQCLGHQAAYGLTEDAVQAGGSASQQVQQVVAEVACVRDWFWLTVQVLKRGDDEFGPVGPAPVQRHLAGAGAGGYPLHRQPRVADLGQFGQRRLEDRGVEHLSVATRPGMMIGSPGGGRHGGGNHSSRLRYDPYAKEAHH
jgi:hypothetical protein